MDILILVALNLLLTCACLVVLMYRGNRRGTVELTSVLIETLTKQTESFNKMIIASSKASAQHSQQIIRLLEKIEQRERLWERDAKGKPKTNGEGE